MGASPSSESSVPSAAWPRAAFARAWGPGQAKAGRGSPSGQGGLGGCARPRLRRAGSLAGSCTAVPGRAGKGRTDQETNRLAGSRLHAYAALPAFLSSRPRSRLPRPGRPAPLRDFGPGSRSCDVISKASALSSDTRPCPGVRALFTAAWAGSGAEKAAQAPPGETAAAAARVAAPAPTPIGSPRAVGTKPPPTRLRR